MSQHSDNGKNTKAWAVSHHTDTGKNTKAGAVSHHTDTGKNTKAWDALNTACIFPRGAGGKERKEKKSIV